MMAFDLFRYFLVLIVPGIMAALLFSFIAHCKVTSSIWFGWSLVFALLIFITMIFGIYCFYRDVKTVDALIVAFNCLRFTRRYALLSILFGLIYGAIAGCIRKWVFWWRKCE